MSEEIEIKSSKFWLLEEKVTEKEKNPKKWLYCNENNAIEKIKELLKSSSAETILLLSIDISGKDWKITQVSWASIASLLFKT